MPLSSRSWWRGAAVALLYTPTAGLLSVHVGLVLSEDGAVDRAGRSAPSTVALSLAYTVVFAGVVPWFARHDRRAGGRWRHPVSFGGWTRQWIVALVSFLLMVVYIVTIEPAGGRRVALSIAIPLLGLPAGIALAWWTCGGRVSAPADRQRPGARGA